MASDQGTPSTSGQPPSSGPCPGCAREPEGARCVHCGVAVTVGSYRVLKVLGQRGASRSYLARGEEGPVVLKELSFPEPPKTSVLQAFHREARQLQALTHPRIPRYLDMLQLTAAGDTRLYLVQEFIEGTPLATELARQRLTELEARELARQVLDILRYLQGRTPPVFHGDLKPANLIRRPDGALFLVDFGAGWVPAAGPGVEASRYTPPEQLQGEVNATTDLFALGALLAEALAWELRAGKGTPESARELLARADVSLGFRQFLGRLTAEERQARLASAQDALRELEQPEHPPLPKRRSPWPVAVGVGASVASFFAGMYVHHRLNVLAVPSVAPLECPAAPPMEPCPEEAAPTQIPPEDEDAHVPEPAESLPGSSGLAVGIATMDNVPRSSPGVQEELVLGHEPPKCEYAHQGTATTSGYWDTGAPEGAIDRDPKTLWRSNESDGAWLQVDLGRARVINAAVLDWAWDTNFGDTAESQLLTSLDGDQWQPLATVVNTPAQNNVPRRLFFRMRAARYVRFLGTRWNGGWAHVKKLELYGAECRLPRGGPADLSDRKHMPDFEPPME